MIKIAIASQQHIVRAALQTFLEKQPDFEIAECAVIDHELLEIITREQVDVVVFYFPKHESNIVQVVHDVVRQASKTGIVILMVDYNQNRLLELFRAGVRAFIQTDDTPEDLIRAIHEAAIGKRFLTHEIYSKVFEFILDTAPGQYNHDDVLDPQQQLTTREREVIQFSVEGYTCRDIAERLGISRRTIETHRGKAMHKLGLHTRIELLRYAISRGILP